MYDPENGTMSTSNGNSVMIPDSRTTLSPGSTVTSLNGVLPSYLQQYTPPTTPVSVPASATSGTIPLAQTYQQFSQSPIASQNPVYTGGNVAGLPASENAMLNSIYNTPVASKKTGGIAGYADGGDTWFDRKMGQYEHRMENTHTGEGFLASPIAGRTDRLPVAVAADSYVIPADVVSGLGQGNSLAGAKILNEALKTGPWGTNLSSPHIDRGDIPRTPAAPSENIKRGGTAHHMPIMVAGGEHIVPPEAVARIGGGDVKKGHKILDELVAKVRKHVLKTIRHLPAPK